MNGIRYINHIIVNFVNCFLFADMVMLKSVQVVYFMDKVYRNFLSYRYYRTMFVDELDYIFAPLDYYQHV